MRRLVWALAIVLAVTTLVAQIAHAQIPRVQLPRLPGVSVPGVAGGLSNTVRDLTSQTAEDVRRLKIRDLLRQHADVVESDPRGSPIVRAELLAFSPSDGALAQAQAAGFQIVRTETLDGLGERIVVLRGPPRVTTQRALARLRQLDPQGSYDFNHLYVESGEAAGVAATTEVAGAGSMAGRAMRVGLIDSGVDVHHPVFEGSSVQLYGCGGVSIPSAHGTGVASLMVGHATSFQGAAPGAGLYAADVYCGLTTGGAVDVVMQAFAWFVKEKVPVINVSLVGPPNVLLERVVKTVVARGHLIVAAVGNDGPAAPPLYPAAYPGVIGVTAVDARQRAIPEAERGPQVKFAAPGADMAAACPPRGYVTVRGTSFAAPIVAGLLALELGQPDVGAAQQAVADLARSAVDLGSKGPDKVYGNGLVGAALRPEPALARQ
ncbi:MAG TPA: S8 family serine peptidase [Steroidobacteraceae bacterium]|jgi:subtilisin family serine protease